MSRRTVATVIIVVGALLAATVSQYWIVTSDGSLYLGLAKSLAEGKGYAFNGELNVRYPVVFPLLMAGVMRVAGVNYLALRLTVAVLAFGVVILTYVFARSRLSPKVALLVTALAGLSRPFVKYATSLLSETPYMFLSLLGLVLANTLAKSKRHVLLCTIGLGIAVALAAQTRVIGFTLVLATLTGLVIESIRSHKLGRGLGRVAVVGMICLLPMALWAWRTSAYTSEETAYFSAWDAFRYKDPWNLEAGKIDVGDVLARIPGSLESRATSYTRVVSSIKGHRRGWRLSFVFLPFILGGLVVQSRRSLLARDGRSVVVELYFVFYAGTLVLFPHEEGTRYVIPVAPLVFVYAAEGVRVALNGLKRLCDAAREAGWSMRLTLSWWAHRGLQVLTGVFVVGAVLYGIGKAVVEAYDQHTAMRGDGRHAVYGSAVMRVELANILNYVDANTQLTDVIMLDGAAVCHWLTGRRTADIPRSSRLSVVAEAIRRQRVTHLVVVRNSGRAESVLGPLLAQRPGDFPEVAHFGRTHVYRVGRTE